MMLRLIGVRNGKLHGGDHIFLGSLSVGGNVGIGTSLAANIPLQIKKVSATANQLVLYNATDATGSYSSIRFQYDYNNTSIATSIRSIQRSVGDNGASLAFFTDDSAGTHAERVGITHDGRLYGTALHNNAGAVTGTTNQYIASGKGTATFTAGANCDSVTNGTIRWQRVGNVVTGSVEGSVDPTSATTLTTFKVDLPIASNFALSTDANGGGTAGVIGTAAYAPIFVTADNTGDKLALSFYSLSTLGHSVSFSFSYEVL